MKIESKNYEDLRRLIEEVTGRKMRTPKDFDLLALRIYDRTRMQLSVSTLKRFWGYVAKEDAGRGELRLSTLNIMANYVGYVSYDAFCHREDVDEAADSSNPYYGKRTLAAADINVGDVVDLMWAPNRLVRIRYSGNNVFAVIESRNSKLSVGDTFNCSFFVEHLPLTLINLIHDGQPPCTYVCGKVGGITFVR